MEKLERSLSKFEIFLVGYVLGFMVMFVIDLTTVNTSDVIKGKQFIYKNATYKCSKTNELKESE